MKKEMDKIKFVKKNRKKTKKGGSGGGGGLINM